MLIHEISVYLGTTNIADCLRLANDELFTEARGDRPDANNVMILLSDGMDNVDVNRLRPEVSDTASMMNSE